MTHDKLCPIQVMVMPWFCCCGLLEAARAEEREKAAQIRNLAEEFKDVGGGYYEVAMLAQTILDILAE